MRPSSLHQHFRSLVDFRLYVHMGVVDSYASFTKIAKDGSVVCVVVWVSKRSRCIYSPILADIFFLEMVLSSPPARNLQRHFHLRRQALCSKASNLRDACQWTRLTRYGRVHTAMSNVHFSMQEVESLEEVLYHRFHKLFGERARFAAWSLKREQCGLKRQMDQTLMKIAAGTFEGEHIDSMTDALESRM